MSNKVLSDKVLHFVSFFLFQINIDEEAMKKSTVKAKKWSFLDDYTDVKDFHRMIPDMAFKVCIILSANFLSKLRYWFITDFLINHLL